MEITYTKLVEKNDWEGETWLFFFPDDEEVIEALNALTQMTESFELYGRGYSDDNVEFLVDELSMVGGYMQMVNKVSISDEKKAELLALYKMLQEGDADSVFEEFDNLMNKGGLFD